MLDELDEFTNPDDPIGTAIIAESMVSAAEEQGVPREKMDVLLEFMFNKLGDNVTLIELLNAVPKLAKEFATQTKA